MGIDVFGDPALFAALWPKMLRAYALDCCLSKGMPESSLTAGEVARRVERIASARCNEQSTPGVGALLAMRGAAFGYALVWSDAVVHISVFEERYSAPVPVNPGPILWRRSPR